MAKPKVRKVWLRAVEGAKEGGPWSWLRANPWSQLVGAGRKDRLARPQGAKLGHLEEW